MKLIFAGIQGSGKGTQAQIIAKELGICHISTGDLLRSSEGKLKEEADSYMSKGILAPDELILKILKQRLEKQDCKKGFILDGYPRNKSQIEDLKIITKIDKLIYIKISDEEAIRRMKGRWNCKKCALAYNYATMPKPKKIGFCDKCNSVLEQRKDDINDEAITKRLKIFHDEINPLLESFPVAEVNGEKTIEQVTEEIIKKLKN
jgi:adenylate kinase